MMEQLEAAFSEPSALEIVLLTEITRGVSEPGYEVPAEEDPAAFHERFMELQGLVKHHYNNQQCLAYYLKGMNLHNDDYQNILNHVNLLPINQRYNFQILKGMCQNLVEARLLRGATKIEGSGSKTSKVAVAAVRDHDSQTVEVLQLLKAMNVRLEALEKAALRERCPVCDSFHEAHRCYIQHPEKAPPGWVPAPRLAALFEANKRKVPAHVNRAAVAQAALPVPNGDNNGWGEWAPSPWLVPTQPSD
jgi:hypothetical protein